MRYPTPNEQVYLQHISKYNKRLLQYIVAFLSFLVLTATIGGIWLYAIMASDERPVGIFAMVSVDVVLLAAILLIRAEIKKNTPNNQVISITDEYHTESRGVGRFRRIIIMRKYTKKEMPCMGRIGIWYLVPDKRKQLWVKDMVVFLTESIETHRSTIRYSSQ